MNIKLSASTIGLLVSSMAFNSSVNAAFIDNDTFTTDTESGLDWLDVSLTNNKSKDYIQSQLVIGGLYEGWEYATGSQFNSLVDSYTLQPRTNKYGSNFVTDGSIDGLIELLGYTIDECEIDYCYTLGYLEDLAPYENTSYLAIIHNNYNKDRTQQREQLWLDAVNVDYVGSYLIRATIPEPPSIILMFSELLGAMGFAQRWNRSER